MVCFPCRCEVCSFHFIIPWTAHRNLYQHLVIKVLSRQAQCTPLQSGSQASPGKEAERHHLQAPQEVLSIVGTKQSGKSQVAVRRVCQEFQAGRTRKIPFKSWRDQQATFNTCGGTRAAGSFTKKRLFLTQVDARTQELASVVAPRPCCKSSPVHSSLGRKNVASPSLLYSTTTTTTFIQAYKFLYIPALQ